MKVAVLYRVMQGWRVPVFERISQLSEIDEFCVYHGGDFDGTKVVNYKGEKAFKSKCLPTLKVDIKLKDRRVCMPVCLTLLYQLIRDRPDVLLCEGASNLFNSLVGFLYKLLFRKKMVWWSLGELQDRKQSFLRKIADAPIRFVERNCDAIICYSNFGAKYFVRIGVPASRVFVAVNVIDTDRKLAEIAKLDAGAIYAEAHQKGEFNLLYVGAITSGKRLEILLEAFAQFERVAPSARLKIVGDGDHMDACRETARELGIRNVEFTGRVVEGVSKLFLEADLFILPGLGGLAVSESLVHGLPVVASVADGCEKDLLGTGAGIIDEQLDAGRLLQHMEAVYENPEMLKRMKQSASEVIRDRYNINTYMDSIRACLKSLSS